MGGRVYKNSPDLHGKISDNTRYMCICKWFYLTIINEQLYHFDWCKHIVNKTQFQKSFTQLIGPSRQHIFPTENDEDNCSAVVSMLNQPAFTEMTIEMHRVVLDTQFSYDSTFVKVSECLKVPNFISMLVVVKSSKTLLTEEAGILRGVFTVIGHPSTIKTKFI